MTLTAQPDHSPVSSPAKSPKGSRVRRKKLACSQCEASYNVAKNLELHLFTHRLDAPGGDGQSIRASGAWICPECGRKFARQASFRSHLTLHMENDNLSCPTCESEFAFQVI